MEWIHPFRYVKPMAGKALAIVAGSQPDREGDAVHRTLRSVFYRYV